MRRFNSDRGAVAVLVASMIVVLMVCAALVIDIGAFYVRKSQLQNAADAAALATAQDCANDVTSCSSSMAGTATDFTVSIVRSGAATAEFVGDHSVKVTTTSTVNYSFAPVIGIDDSDVSARATASWGAVSGGPAVLPIAFARCLFDTTGVEQVIFLRDSMCSGTSIPGGFGWLQPSEPAPAPPASRCTVNIIVGNDVPQSSSEGRSIPSVCKDSDFTAQTHGNTILLPVYDEANSVGKTYHIYGYAAFRLTGYSKFEGSGGVTEWNSTNAKCKLLDLGHLHKCNESENWIFGYFTKFVSLSEAFTYSSGVPNLGATVVDLTG